MVLCTFTSIRHNRPADSNNKYGNQQPNERCSHIMHNKISAFLEKSDALGSENYVHTAWPTTRHVLAINAKYHS